jgi:dienelactone hydrolase
MKHALWRQPAQRQRIGALAILALMSGWAYAADIADVASRDAWIASRDVQIPVTLVTPTGDGAQAMPLAVLIHGHGGTRHEAGGFTRIAAGLAQHGIASVRMDFPGCGDSTESFANNNLTNMLADIKAGQAYALQELNIDPARIGLLGFSMGGRLALSLAAENNIYRAMGLWAPSARNGADNMAKYLGGADVYVQKRAQAKEQGWAPFTTFWGQDQQLGFQWFTDLEKSTPRDDVVSFTGALFVLYGDEDDVVTPDISAAVARDAANASAVLVHVVRGADHGLGLFNDDWARSEEAVTNTVTFFAEQL